MTRSGSSVNSQRHLANYSSMPAVLVTGSTLTQSASLLTQLVAVVIASSCHCVHTDTGWVLSWCEWLATEQRSLSVQRHSTHYKSGSMLSKFAQSIYHSIFPFIALTLLVGQQEGHPACKTLGVGLLVVTIWLELCMTYSTSCHHHLHHPQLQ